MRVPAGTGKQESALLPDGGGGLVAFDDPSVTVFEAITIGPESIYFTIPEYESDIWVMDLEW